MMLFTHYPSRIEVLVRNNKTNEIEHSYYCDYYELGDDSFTLYDENKEEIATYSTSIYRLQSIRKYDSSVEARYITTLPSNNEVDSIQYRYISIKEMNLHK